MKLAINYSPQAAALFTQGRINIDRFKTPPWADMVAEALQLAPVAVHFDLKAGNGKVKDPDWSAIEHFLALTSTPYVNLHLNPTIKHYEGLSQDSTNAGDYRRVVDRMIADVDIFCHHFGADRVIVENVPYRGQAGKTLRIGVEPAAIREVVETTGCGLLLDISHARIAAHALGMDEQVYMSLLPIQRLRELHFTGLHVIGDQLQDHLPVLDSDWPVLLWVLQQIHRGQWSPAWMLAFEYGGVGEIFSWRSDPQVIEAQVPRLYRLVEDA